MTTRRVSLLAGLLCLIASMSVAAAPPTSSLIDGKIAGQELCWQELCGFAFFFGTFNGKVNGEHTIGTFTAIVQHESPLPTQPGATAKVTSGSWTLRTQLGNFAGTVSGHADRQEKRQVRRDLDAPNNYASCVHHADVYWCPRPQRTR